MGVYIKNWSIADWKELLKWARIGENNAMIGEFAEVEEIPPHGDLIDADKLVELCDIMADKCVNKCDGIGATIWHQFKATVEWSPIVIPEEEPMHSNASNTLNALREECE